MSSFMPSNSEREVQFDSLFELCERSQDKFGKSRRHQQRSQDQDVEAANVSQDRKDLSAILQRLSKQLGTYQDVVSRIVEIAPRYDPKVPPGRDRRQWPRANGFRSFAAVAASFVDVVTAKLMSIGGNMTSCVSAKDLKELAALNDVLDKLIEISGFLLEMHAINVENSGENGALSLFPTNLTDFQTERMKELATKIGATDYSAFYGRACGFHFRSDFGKMARPFVVAMAAYADVFAAGDGSEGCWTRLTRAVRGLNGFRRALFDPEAAAGHVYSSVRAKPVEFCQSFYNFSEMDLIHPQSLRFRVGNSPWGATKIKCNQQFKIPSERMSLENAAGAQCQVPVPSAHVGDQRPIQVRLISPFRTPDMLGSCPCSINWPGNSCSCRVIPESECVIFHVHGGGFVSQTSKSHAAAYLKAWSHTLGVPILSVDYSCAPEIPYPRAVQEVLYAYCWMRKNFKMLGTTGRKVICVGDSAGANLLSGLTLQLADLSLPLPDHLVLNYPALLCHMFPSPSRLLSLLDPVLMFPCLLRCLNAYSDPDYRTQGRSRTFEQELEYCHRATNFTDPLLSPLLAEDSKLRRFPPTTLVTTDLDPCLDETVAFSNKLVDLDVGVDLQVLRGLPHGFLSMSSMSRDCQAATDHIAEMIRDVVLN